MARDRIVGADPADLNLILGLWHLRLSCLARLRLFNQTAAECTNLFTVLNNVQPPEARLYLFERLLPFELEVMQTRLKYWAGDHMGYLDSLAALLRKCKISARKGASTKDATTSAMWKERGARVALIMASQMVEMKARTSYPLQALVFTRLCRSSQLLLASSSPCAPMLHSVQPLLAFTSNQATSLPLRSTSSPSPKTPPQMNARS